VLKRLNKQLRDERGFTLIEMLVVIAIIGILAAIAIPSLSGATQKSKVAKAQADLRTLESAITMYYVEENTYPTNLQALVTKEYIKRVPKDPWDMDYQYYSATGMVCVLRSAANGITDSKALFSYGEDIAPTGT